MQAPPAQHYPRAIFAPPHRAKMPSQETKLDVAIRLTDGTRVVIRTRRELGFQRVDQSTTPSFTIDQELLAGALKRLAPLFAHEAGAARPVVQAGKFVILPGDFARQLNVAESVDRLRTAVEQNPALTQFTVVLTKTPPTLTANRLQGMTGVLAQMVTHTSPNVKRNRNIQLASEAIDGTLLAPGEVFSLNETVGKRTQARGYRTATVFVGARKVNGIGGGVSQVTGTLFNAAALADLTIKEVHPHSRPVSYLPLGRDATVAYGEKDLKFVNSTAAPVFIAYTLQGTTLTATLYGAPVLNRKITLTPAVRHRGPGRINAQLYRTVYENGKLVTKERLFSHAYRWKANGSP